MCNGIFPKHFDIFTLGIPPLPHYNLQCEDNEGPHYHLWRKIEGGEGRGGEGRGGEGRGGEGRGGEGRGGEGRREEKETGIEEEDKYALPRRCMLLG